MGVARTREAELDWRLMRALTTVVAALLLLAAGIAAAEHEVYYRYVVLGFVKDARGKPVRGRTVEIGRQLHEEREPAGREVVHALEIEISGLEHVG